MKKVLIVDDNENFRKGLKVVLYNIEQNISITEASNGKEFLEILNHKKPDIVFIDVKMPFVDGIDATKEARKLYSDVLIFAFSSYENDNYIKSMFEAGVNGYLCKSKDNYDLISQIINNSETCNFSGNI